MPDRFTLLEIVARLGSASSAELAGHLGERVETVRVAVHRACRAGYLTPVETGYALTDRGVDRLEWLRAQQAEQEPVDEPIVCRCACRVWSDADPGTQCPDCGELLEEVLPRGYDADPGGDE